MGAVAELAWRAGCVGGFDGGPVRLGAEARLLIAPGRACALGWLAGEGGEGGRGEVPAGDGHHEVVDGDGEGPFAGRFADAADGQLAEAHVVLDAAVGGLGDAAALPVGGDALRCPEAGRHRGGRPIFRARAVPAYAGVPRAGGFLQVAVLAGGDEPAGAGAGEVALGQVAGVGEDQTDRAVPRAAGG